MRQRARARRGRGNIFAPAHKCAVRSQTFHRSKHKERSAVPNATAKKECVSTATQVRIPENKEQAKRAVRCARRHKKACCMSEQPGKCRHNASGVHVSKGNVANNRQRRVMHEREQQMKNTATRCRQNPSSRRSNERDGDARSEVGRTSECPCQPSFTPQNQP